MDDDDNSYQRYRRELKESLKEFERVRTQFQKVELG